MSGPRNRIAYSRSQAVRERIRTYMATWDPLREPLTAERVKIALHLSASVRTVRWHMARIRLEAELATIDAA